MSAHRCALGFSVLLLASGCDSSGGGANAPVPVDGGGAGGTGGGGGQLPEGVSLAIAEGWVDGASNSVGIQGAVFAYADDTSGVGLTDNTAMGTKACISGTAAKVDLNCTPVAPATDCYGTFWGAAIGLNLNQPIDPVTNEGKDPPDPYDATANGVTGFAFMVDGPMVPTGMRFKVENATTEFCTPTAKNIKSGANTYTFDDLVSECWQTGGTSATTAKSALIKIAWHVVTNDSSTVPFDFCISDLRALK